MLVMAQFHCLRIHIHNVSQYKRVFKRSPCGFKLPKIENSGKTAEFLWPDELRVPKYLDLSRSMLLIEVSRWSTM